MVHGKGVFYVVGLGFTFILASSHENIKTSSNKLNSVRILIKQTKMSRGMFQVSTAVFVPVWGLRVGFVGEVFMDFPWENLWK